ncbi:MAG: hypothetical protein RSB77_00145 [Bacilli bacterium]
MEDKIIMGNILTLLKGLCGTSFHGVIESKELTDQFKEVLDEYLNAQKITFNAAEKEGFYPTTEAKKDYMRNIKKKALEN